MWHYQIGKRTTEAGEVYYGIYEVYYRDEESTKPFSATVEPVEVIGEDPEEVKKVLAMMMLDALKYPVIDLDDDTQWDMGEEFKL